MTLFEMFKMNCRQATLLAQKKSESKIGAMEKLGLWLHFLRCSLCRLFLRQSELICKETARLGQSGLTLDSKKKENMAEVLKTKFKE